jgi:hypothetical protein
MPVLLPEDDALRREIVARMEVLHAGRRELGALALVSPSTLPGRAAVSGLLLAARSIPHQRSDIEAVDWLVDDWDFTLHRILDHETRDDAGRVPGARQCLESLRKSLREAGSPSAIHDLVGAVDATCRTVYGRAWVEPTIDVQTASAVRLGRRGADAPGAGWEGTDGDCFAMSAKTVRTAESVTVTLSLWLKEFGPETYAALPRLLMHELFCHVVGGHDPDDVSQNSSFAEGWMDWAAEYYFRRDLLGRNEGVPDTYSYASESLMTALDRRGPEGAARITGRHNAAALASWLTRVGDGMSQDEASQATADLAVAVNLLRCPLSVKTLFTEELGTLGLRRPDDENRVTAALRRWSRGALAPAELVATVTADTHRWHPW